MPNHTANILIISGHGASGIAKRHLKRHTKGSDPVGDDDESNEFLDTLDLNSIVPRPIELEGTETGTRAEQGLAVLRYRISKGNDTTLRRMMGYRWAMDMGIDTPEKMIEHIEKTWPDAMEIGERSLKALDATGYANWYDWSMAKWGTKWNAYDGSIMQEDGADWIALCFTTAWSPPDAALSSFKDLYPDLRFLELCADEGGGFLSAYEFLRDGALDTIVDAGDWTSPEAKMLLRKLGRSDQRRPPRSFKSPDSWGWDQIMKLEQD